MRESASPSRLTRGYDCACVAGQVAMRAIAPPLDSYGECSPSAASLTRLSPHPRLPFAERLYGPHFG
jgi:hypothetical protein